MYRIYVDSEARAQLTSLRPHVVARVGRLLAELADVLAAGGSTDGRLLVEDCAIHCEVDRDECLLRVMQIERRELPGRGWTDEAQHV